MYGPLKYFSFVLAFFRGYIYLDLYYDLTNAIVQCTIVHNYDDDDDDDDDNDIGDDDEDDDYGIQ